MTNEEFNVVKEECKDALEKSDTPKDFVLLLIKIIEKHQAEE